MPHTRRVDECAALGRFVAHWCGLRSAEDERLGTRWCTEPDAQSCMHSIRQTLRVGTLFSTVLSLDTGLKGVCQLFPIDGSAPLGQHKSTERSTREVLAKCFGRRLRTYHDVRFASEVGLSQHADRGRPLALWPGVWSLWCSLPCLYTIYTEKISFVSPIYTLIRALATNWLPGSSTGRDCDDSQSGGGGVRGGSGQWGKAS